MAMDEVGQRGEAIKMAAASAIDVELSYGSGQFEGGFARLSATPTGHKKERGMVSLKIWDWEASAELMMSSNRARELATLLNDLADKAENFSTRGFVGADE